MSARGGSELHRIKLTVPNGVSALATIELDGVPLRGVTAAAYVSVNKVAQVVLTMYADLVIEGEVEIVQEWRNALPWWRRLPYWVGRQRVAR